MNFLPHVPYLVHYDAQHLCANAVTVTYKPWSGPQPKRGPHIATWSHGGLYSAKYTIYILFPRCFYELEKRYRQVQVTGLPLKFQDCPALCSLDVATVAYKSETLIATPARAVVYALAPKCLAPTTHALNLPTNFVTSLVYPYVIWQESMQQVNVAMEKLGFHAIIHNPIRPVGHELGRFLTAELSQLRNPCQFNLDFPISENPLSWT